MNLELEERKRICVKSLYKYPYINNPEKEEITVTDLFKDDNIN